MELIAVEKTRNSIYEITYKSGFLKKTKTEKVYPWVGYWRYFKNGETLPYRIETTLDNIGKFLKDGDIFIVKAEGEKLS